MRTSPLLLPLLIAFALGACSRPMPLGPGDTTGTGSTGGTGTGTGAGGDGDPIGPPAPPPIVSVDPTVYALTLSGSFTSTGTATGVLFLTTGNAMWNVGTCTGNVALGTDGTWVTSSGTSAPHNPNCIAYWSNGHSGANGKGICTFTSQGYIGLWLNPGGHRTSPYHTKCLETGTVISSLTLTFTQAATLYTANDGSGRKILDFSDGTGVTGQLVYTGTTADYTTGTGSITATDGDGGTWTLDLTQAAFFWYTGAVNGDVISQLQSPGVEAVACNATVGCVLTTVQLGG
ncbi:MAG: hypothetical protein ACM3OH_03800 [Bacillota bacterium]|jgi:hypothetical protein